MHPARTVPLTPTQMHLWLLDRRLGAEMTLITRAEPLGDRIGAADLARAVQRTAERLAVLRTRIEIERGRPVQRVDPAGAAPTVTTVPGDSGYDGALAILAEEQRAALTPIDLDRSPPVRLELCEYDDATLLVLTAHPIVADEVSVATILREVIGRAAGGLREEDPPGYTDHISDVLRAIGPRRLATLRRYWAEHDRCFALDASGYPDHTGIEAVALELDDSYAARVLAIGSEGPGSLAGALASCFGAAQQQVNVSSARTLGLAVDTRPTGRSAVIGPLTAVVPLAIDVPSTGPTQSSLAAMAREARRRVAHAPLPLADLLGAEAFARSPRLDMWIEEDGATATHLSRLTGLERTPQVVRRARGIAGLRLLAHRRPAGLALALEYQVAKTARDTAAQFLEQVAVAVSRVPTQPAKRRPVARRHSGVPENVATLLQDAAERHPDEPAVVEDGGGRRTYAELMAESDDLAAQIRGCGVRRDDIVVAVGPRSIALITSIIAILRAGGAVLALDPEGPPHRLRTIVRQSGSKLLVVPNDKERVAKFAAEMRVLRVPAASTAARAPLPARIDSKALAYAVFTSGSTGDPKGVLVEHRSLVNQLMWLRDAIRLRPGDRVAFKYPLGFDAAYSELFGSLAAGATVVAARPNAERDAGYLLDLCARERLTVLDVTPTQLEALLRHPRARALRVLRTVLCGGETLQPSTARRLFEAAPAELLNVYGPAEATITATFHRVRPEDVASRAIPIGRAVPKTSVHVLDGAGRPVPTGEVAELCIGGIQLARGYVAARGADRSRFGADPSSPVPGARLFRTGDLGRTRSDGTLELIGRVDRQIQVRGHRVEPGEIEAALMAHPLVRQCAVVPVSRRGLELHAYLTPERPLDDAEQLRSFLRERLPAVMRPNRYFAVGELPRLASGKLDRAALERCAATELTARVVPRPVPTDIEATIAQTFASVLELDGLGVGESFFDLGGDSLAAVELVVELERALGRPVEIRDVFEAPTPVALAERLEDTFDVMAGLKVPAPLAPGCVSNPHASAAQCEVLVERPAARPLVQLGVRLPSRLPRDALDRAAQMTIDRHGALRTALEHESGEWRQHVREDLAAKTLHYVVNGDADLASLLRDRAWQPFDLAAPPLIRFHFVDIADTATALLITSHRAVCDEWSLEIALRDFSRFLFHLTEGCALPAALATGYAEYSRWLSELAVTGALEEQRAHWQALQASAGPARGGDSSSARAAVVTIRGSLEPDLLEALRTRCTHWGLGLGAALRAALCIAMADEGASGRYIGDPDGGRRGLRALDGVIGPFERVLPVVLPERADRGLVEFAAALRDRVGRARSNALGAASLRALAPARVSFRHRSLSPLRVETVSPLLSVPREPPAAVDLEIVAIDDGDGLRIDAVERVGSWPGPPAAAVHEAYVEHLRRLATGGVKLG